MAQYAIVIRDGSNNLIMGPATRITRVLSASVAVTTADGSVTDARLAEANARVWWRMSGGDACPAVTRSGNTLSWAWGTIPTNRRGSRTLVYGLY